MIETERYFSQAESWSTDTRRDAARSRRAAWLVAGVAVGIAAFEAVALAMLAPLKTVQPVTLLVDRQTGFVQALDPLTPRRVAADDALTNSLLAQYVTAREEFDRATVSADYRRVALWSAGQTRQGYLARMPANNPSSPFQRYPSGAVVETRIKSVSRLNAGVALVRFDTQLHGPAGQADAAQPWIAVVRFQYADAPMRFEDRLVNPLGFQVTGYRRDAEAPPPVAAQAVVQPTAVSPVTSQPVRPTIVVREEPMVARSRLAPRSDPARAAVAVERREVPLANLPLGSPLSPTGAPGMAR